MVVVNLRNFSYFFPRSSVGDLDSLFVVSKLLAEVGNSLGVMLPLHAFTVLELSSGHLRGKVRKVEEKENWSNNNTKLFSGVAEFSAWTGNDSVCVMSLVR